MAVNEHHVLPTATVSRTAAATVAAFPARFAGIKDTFSNLTFSVRDVLQIPLRLAVRLNRLLEAPRQLLDTGTRVAGSGAMAEAAQAAAVQPAADAVGWRRALAEAFQLSNSRSYWGMLHYITSRWALVTFSLVCLTPSQPKP